MKRRNPGRGKTANDACFLHDGELSLGSSQFVRVQVARFDKNWRTWHGEKMVEDRMTRRRSCKTVRGQNIRELKEQVVDTLGRGENMFERRR